jgi:tRNA nucleotidyltransferase (CCA-adding enzyme)
VAFGVSLDEDLARRDFTINAIAYHPLRHEWRDPFDGHGDLFDRKVVRAVGDARQRFREDYLRIVRALRFSARFGFPIADATWEAARAEVEGLKQLSAERVRDEWFKGLETARAPGVLLDLWDRVGALNVWLPEVVKRETGNVKRDADVVDRFPVRDPVLVTAYLSADPEGTLRRLRCSNAEIERGRRIGEYRDAWPAVVTDVSVRHWLAEVGGAADDLLAMALAEGWGGELADVAARVRHSHAPLTLADLALRGTDLVKLGVPEGPDIGVVLDALLDLVLEHPELNTREALLHEVTKLTGEMPIPPEIRKRVTDSIRRSGQL